MSRFASCSLGGRAFAALVEGDEALPLRDVAELGAATPSEVLADPPLTGERIPLADVTLRPVVPRPGKIVCVGLNYKAHVAEGVYDLPEYPALFPKWADTLVAAGAPIALPPESEAVDFEAELAFVVGRGVRRVTGEEALAAVGGYTIANDVSMRDYQYKSHQWLAGKCWARSTPLGPFLVTPDEVGDPHALDVSLELNGERMQAANTRQFIFDIPTIVATISEFTPLAPGDVVLTGRRAASATGATRRCSSRRRPARRRGRERRAAGEHRRGGMSRAAVSVTFDNLGEASDLERGWWPEDEPLGRHFSVTLRAPARARGARRGGAARDLLRRGHQRRVYPETLTDLDARGHEVACHGWRHERWTHSVPSTSASLLARARPAGAARPAPGRVPAARRRTDLRHARLLASSASPTARPPRASTPGRCPRSRSAGRCSTPSTTCRTSAPGASRRSARPTRCRRSACARRCSPRWRRPRATAGSSPCSSTRSSPTRTRACRSSATCSPGFAHWSDDGAVTCAPCRELV